MESEVKNANYFQSKWNEILHAHTPNHISLAREIAELLDISLDSAYRRLRNDTAYTLGEAALIANHFNLPLEVLNNELHSVVSFRINKIDNSMDSYKTYLANIRDSLIRIGKLENPVMYYGAEDIPVFYHFSAPHLSRFKMIYWLKSLMLIPEFQYKNYHHIEIPQEIMDMASEISELFSHINSIEVWTTETAVSTIKQIMFYWDAGFFEEQEHALEITEDLERIVRNIQRCAETGYKFTPGGTMLNTKFQLFASDVMIGTNSILAQANNFSASFISYSTFNFMQTNNVEFNRQNQMWMNNLISRSALISTTAEKQRNQFFKGIYKQIEALKLHLRS